MSNPPTAAGLSNGAANSAPEASQCGSKQLQQQASFWERSKTLVAATWRLTHTVSEGGVEGLVNALTNLVDLLPPVVRREEVPYPDDLTGKVAIVTGGNAGIGFATAKQLARRGTHVVLACRDKARAEAAVQEISRTLPLPGCCGAQPSWSPGPTPASTSTAASTSSSAPTPPTAAANSSNTVSAPAATLAAASASPPSSSPPPPALRVEAMELDLGRLASVRQFAEEWARRGLPLHLLVCNAGVMAPLKRTATADGLEVQFQVNFLSHWLLTHLLVERERKRRKTAADAAAAVEAASPASAAETASARGQQRRQPSGGGDAAASGRSRCSEATRVVIVSSVVHRAGPLQWGDLLSERSYEPYITYGLSKLATVIFAKELQRRLERHPEYGKYDSAVAIHPGIVRTHLANNFFRTYGLSWAAGTPLEPLRTLWCGFLDTAGQALLATTEVAARRMLHACLAPREAVAGRYLSMGRVYGADKASDDPSYVSELWATATRLTGHSPGASLA